MFKHKKPLLAYPRQRLSYKKIHNFVINVLANIYVLFIIYATPVVMIILFAFQNYPAIRSKTLSFDQFTLVNFFSNQDYQLLTRRGKLKPRPDSIEKSFQLYCLAF